MDTKTNKCVDKIYQNAEATNLYDTHQECSTVGNCTVKANINKTNGLGCINRTACSNYTI